MKRHCDKCKIKLSISAGIQCRCGGLYCSNHRYMDLHDCKFDICKMKDNIALGGGNFTKIEKI
jgi:hypothetical protein